jgi:hypothetical protein
MESESRASKPSPLIIRETQTAISVKREGCNQQKRVRFICWVIVGLILIFGLVALTQLQDPSGRASSRRVVSGTGSNSAKEACGSLPRLWRRCIPAKSTPGSRLRTAATSSLTRKNPGLDSGKVRAPDRTDKETVSRFPAAARDPVRLWPPTYSSKTAVRVPFRSARRIAVEKSTSH